MTLVTKAAEDKAGEVGPTTESTIPPRILQLLEARAGKIRIFPEVATRAIEITRNPDCSIAEFVGVVEKDVMLASEILRMANSVMYGQGKSISSLHRAIPRIGFRQCRNLIVTASTMSLMQNIPMPESQIRDALSRHSITTSTVAASLNRMLSLGFCGEEFAAGLLHDIGRLLLLWISSDAEFQWDFANFDEGPDLLEREMAALGTTHTQVGTWIGETYRLPPEFLDVISCHHHPAQARTAEKLTALVAIADQMANYVQTTKTADGYTQTENEASQVLAKYVPNCVTEINQLGSDILWESTADAHSLCPS
jgi:putative nucleotidyltransferase with HDIG domain